MTPYIDNLDTARRAMGDCDLVIIRWDAEWNSYGAFPRSDSTLTPANVRGILKRNLADNRYAVDILEDAIDTGFENLRTGAIFRFREMEVGDLPPQKRTPIRAFVPPEPTEHQQREMF